MKIDVGGAESCPLEWPERNVSGSWFGPLALGADELRAQIVGGLESPTGGLPPLRQMVVPGDRVALAVDLRTPGWVEILDAVVERLKAGGVEPEGMTVLTAGTTGGVDETIRTRFPGGIVWKIHDPQENGELAYLATTRGGRRIYLNRAVTDADFVVSLGRLERSPLRMLGGPWAREAIVGPWNAIYPSLSDGATQAAACDLAEPEADKRGRVPHPAGGHEEAREVEALLGLVFEIGVIPAGGGGVHAIHAGALRESAELKKQVRDAWRFEPESDAELVVARIGQMGEPVTWSMLVAGIVSAVRVAREGGTLIVFGTLGEEAGKAVTRLAAGDEARLLRAIRGMNDAGDYALAQAIAGIAPAWHVGLAVSGIDRDLVEGLGFLPIEGVATARRLMSSANSCVFVERPEITGIRIMESP